MGKRRTGKQGRQALPAEQVSLAPAVRDLGAAGQANRHGLVVERLKDSPNGEKRARRVDMLEVYLRRGTVTDRQHAAGVALRDAWARTQMGPSLDLTQERVDKSPDPGRAVTIAIDAMSRYASLTKRIPAADADVLHTVACLERSVQWLPRYRGEAYKAGERHMRDALDRLAGALRM